MPDGLARALLGGVTAYLAAGVLFALPFVARGVGQLDPAARGASLGFRVLCFPGAVLLWPLLAGKLLRARRA